MMFGRKIQSNLPTVNIAEKDMVCRREQWKRQYNERSHTLKDLNRGQCVRVQDYTTKKWEPAVINQTLSQPRSYMLTTNTGSQYRRNRRHIGTTTEVFRNPERHNYLSGILPVFGNKIDGYRNSKRMAINGMVKRLCKEEDV